jgi:hypothetical protein
VGRVWKSSRRVHAARPAEGRGRISYEVWGIQPDVRDTVQQMPNGSPFQHPGLQPRSFINTRQDTSFQLRSHRGTHGVIPYAKEELLIETTQTNIENNGLSAGGEKQLASNKPARSDAYPDCRFCLTGRLSGSHKQQTGWAVCWLNPSNHRSPSPNHSAPHSQGKGLELERTVQG